MNFLLHHHLAGRDLGRPEAAVGAMLPDVWRMADRRARARATEGRGGESPGRIDVVRSVAEGIGHHLEVDAWFHGAPVFERGESAARGALRAARDSAKLGLFAHIAWELCLDGALLRRVGIEKVLRAVRESIGAVRPDAHHQVARAWLPDLPEEDRGRFEIRVDEILDAIAEGRWVAGYATAAGIVERLDGLRARLGFAPMTKDDRDAVAAALGPVERVADAGLEEILR